MHLFLLTHIITASLTLLICTIAWIHPTRKIQTYMRVLTSMSFGSGVLLAFDQDHFTRSFCLRLAAYLLVIIASEFKLYKSLEQKVINKELIT